MPKALLDFLGYMFFFWSNEGTEPPHIHVSKGAANANATKFRITKDGSVIFYRENGTRYTQGTSAKHATTARSKPQVYADSPHMRVCMAKRSVSIQSSLKDLDAAYQNFFRRVKQGDTKAGFPHFKSKKSYKTKFTNNNIQVLGKQRNKSK